MFKAFWKKHRILSVVILLILLLLIVAVVAFFWWRGRCADSLAILEGEIICEGLKGEVSILRDVAGVPVIEGASRRDVFFAQGFVHAQERFFQMDFCRRYAAGELSEMFGGEALPLDKKQAPKRHRNRSRAMLKALDARALGELESYSAGVNAGLKALGDVPPEYLVLPVAPHSWKPEDTMLIAFFFFDSLSFNESFEKPVGVMEETLPRELHEFLTPDTTRFDRPLVKETAFQPLPIPGPDVVNLREGNQPATPDRDIVRTADNLGIGSNNWVVAGKRSTASRAMLANDPHLRAMIPPTWYRLRLKWPGAEVTGLSVPGSPGVLIGENGHLAWGFTNGMADHEDLVIVETVDGKKDLYRTPDGERAFETGTVTLKVAGGEDITLATQDTLWGPVIDRDWKGRPLALKSTGLNAATHNFRIFDIMEARTLEEGIAAAASWYGPSQNVLIASDTGRIAWVLSGFLVRRRGFDGKAPRSWADGSCSWDGPLKRPMSVDPGSGVLFSANGRMLPAASSREISRVWIPGWRASRIADMLEEKEKLSADDLARMQLDCRLAQYERYRDLILREVSADAGADIAQALAMVKAWDGRAELDSRGLGLLKVFAERLREAVFAPLVAPAARADERFLYSWPLKEEPLFELLDKRPLHLLAPEWASWSDLVRGVFGKVVHDVDQDGRMSLTSTWGEIRPPHYDHILSRNPWLRDWLSMPVRPLPGDTNTVRAQGAVYGASMRMVVTPGESEKGLFQMPGGQSGHFMSPFYSDHHHDWMEGHSRPLAPGAARWHLTLKPAR